jgi:hypothetical protein
LFSAIRCQTPKTWRGGDPVLTERCLNVAAMDENEVWRAFGSHPEGLNAAKWKNPRRAWR